MSKGLASLCESIRSGQPLKAWGEEPSLECPKPLPSLKFLGACVRVRGSPPPLGGCALAVLGFSMTEAAMTVSQLGKDLSSCLHSSCTTLRPSPGPAAAGNTSPASWSKWGGEVTFPLPGLSASCMCKAGGGEEWDAVIAERRCVWWAGLPWFLGKKLLRPQRAMQRAERQSCDRGFGTHTRVHPQLRAGLLFCKKRCWN